MWSRSIFLIDDGRIHVEKWFAIFLDVSCKSLEPGLAVTNRLTDPEVDRWNVGDNLGIATSALDIPCTAQSVRKREDCVVPYHYGWRKGFPEHCRTATVCSFLGQAVLFCSISVSMKEERIFLPLARARGKSPNAIRIVRIRVTSVAGFVIG